MTEPRLSLGRAEILAHRRLVGSLDGRMPKGEASLRRAAWAGLQDSMPRAALLSIHARIEGTTPTAWEEAPLVQVWGPRYSAYVIAAADRAVFTVGRLPDDAGSRRGAEDMATRLDAFLDGRVMGAGEAARGIGVRHPNALRYGASSGRILIRWDGARRPTVWTVPPPTIDPLDARQELVRRYIHVFGPATPEAFAEWAGVSPAVARTTFAGLGPWLVPSGPPLATAGSSPRTRRRSAPPLPGRAGEIPPERRHILPAAGRRPRAPGP